MDPNKIVERVLDGTPAQNLMEFTPGAPVNRVMAKAEQMDRETMGGAGKPPERPALRDGGGNMDAFTRAYIDTALATTTDESDESGGVPMDRSYGIGDIDENAVTKMRADCAQFQQENSELLAASGLNDRRAGRDFWLSRNGHGTGFWDEHSMDDDDPQFQACKQLHDKAHDFGTYDLYLGDDGAIFGYPH